MALFNQPAPWPPTARLCRLESRTLFAGDVTTGLLAHYNFNDTFDDSSGQAVHATPDGFTDDPFVKRGAWGTGLDLAGASTRVLLDHTLVHGRDQLTYTLWWRHDQNGERQTLLSGVNPLNNNELMLFVPADGRSLDFYTGRDTSTRRNLSFTSVVPDGINDGRWHHLAFTRDVDNSRLEVYINVTLATRVTTSGDTTLEPIVVSPGGLVLGEEQDSVGGSFDPTQDIDGVVDDVRFYNRILTADDVQALLDPTVADGPDYATDQGQPLVVDAASGLLAGRADLATARSLTNPSAGTVSVDADGSFTYTPDAGFNGTDTFLFQDSETGTVAEVTLNVAANSPPDAGTDRYRLVPASPLTVGAAEGLLVNDTDPEGDPLEVSSHGQPTFGTVTVDPDGGFTYTPDADADTDATGPDLFTYTVSDGRNGATTGTVLLYLNRAPTTAGGTGRGDEDTELTGNLAANDADGDALTFTLTDPPLRGAATVNDAGEWAYTPDLDAYGTDTFTYRVDDGFGGVATGVVNLTIDPVNDSPATTAAVFETGDGGLVTDTLSDAVSDPDSDALTYSLVDGPTAGTLTLASNGAFTFEAAAGQAGSVGFTYRVSDGLAEAEGTAELLIEANPDSQPPTSPDAPDAPDTPDAPGGSAPPTSGPPPATGSGDRPPLPSTLTPPDTPALEPTSPTTPAPPPTSGPTPAPASGAASTLGRPRTSGDGSTGLLEQRLPATPTTTATGRQPRTGGGSYTPPPAEPGSGRSAGETTVEASPPLNRSLGTPLTLGGSLRSTPDTPAERPRDAKPSPGESSDPPDVYYSAGALGLPDAALVTLLTVGGTLGWGVRRRASRPTPSATWGDR